MNISAKICSTFTFRFLRNVESTCRAGIQLCAFLVVFYCVWILDRGFDITDEAYYLLLAIHSDSVKYYISAQQWLTAGLWHLTGSITMFRASGLILLLASSVLLARGVFLACLRCGLVADRSKNMRVILAGSVIGALLYASTINLSPCYNLLASAGAYAAAGLVLLAVNRSSIPHKYALIAIAGFAVGVEAISKPSAGVATLALLVFWGGVFERSHRDKFFELLAMIFGFVVFTGITLLCNTTLSDAIRAVVEGMGLFRMVQVETVQARLARYFIEFSEFILLTLKTFALPLALMIAYRVTYRSIYAYLGLAALAVTLVCGNLDLGTVSFSVHNVPCRSFLFGGFNRYYAQAVALFSMLVMALMVSAPAWNKNWSTLALFAGLFLLPYSVALGTGNPLFSQVLDSLAPWGALTAVLAVAHPHEYFCKKTASLIVLCFAMTAMIQIATSSLRPYHLSQSLVKQDRTAIIGNLGDVKVDAATYRFLSEMRSAVKECNIAPGTPFVGLYNIPGVALVLQATPVLTPWLNNMVQAEFVVERMVTEGVHPAVVALKMEESGTAPLLPQQLAGFPAEYRYCGMATYPYLQQRIQIWQSSVRNKP